MSEKTGVELLVEASAEPTLDEYLRRDPATLSPRDIEQLIAIERKRRAMFIDVDKKKKEKKRNPEAVAAAEAEEEKSDAQG